MKPTQSQRDAFRYALEDKGVPEVISFMAAQNLDEYHKQFGTAAMLIYYGFSWYDAPEGYDFWEAVHNNCKGLK